MSTFGIRAIPQGVVQNGARMLSPDVIPGIRPVPITHTGTKAAAVRSVQGGSWKRSESDLPCDSPLVSSTPKEDHTYSNTQSGGHLTSQEDGTSGETGETTTPSNTEDEGRGRGKKDPPLDPAQQAQHKRRQHWTAKARLRLSSDSLPLKKRRTQKPPESDDEEMKEAAGSLLHLAGVRACLNNITNRTAKGQKEQKDTLKNEKE
ncbi:hypothetical protein JZ751_004824 [Albula glossodonta]|uniref:Forkhead box protein N3 n=1 Tax=Albula glossodonta TaxID=121402 RepID=A0A8T2PES5_9TELE|nr:hypothetical protein JZ751_004824 [Albula glossodonta]